MRQSKPPISNALPRTDSSRLAERLDHAARLVAGQQLSVAAHLPAAAEAICQHQKVELLQGTYGNHRRLWKQYGKSERRAGPVKLYFECVVRGCSAKVHVESLTKNNVTFNDIVPGSAKWVRLTSESPSLAIPNACFC